MKKIEIGGIGVTSTRISFMCLALIVILILSCMFWFVGYVNGTLRAQIDAAKKVERDRMAVLLGTNHVRDNIRFFPSDDTFAKDAQKYLGETCLGTNMYMIVAVKYMAIRDTTDSLPFLTNMYVSEIKTGPIGTVEQRNLSKK